MTEFDDLEKKAETYVREHPEQAGDRINEVTEFTEHDPDHQHDDQIDRAVEAAERDAVQHRDQPG